MNLIWRAEQGGAGPLYLGAGNTQTPILRGRIAPSGPGPAASRCCAIAACGCTCEFFGANQSVPASITFCLCIDCVLVDLCAVVVIVTSFFVLRDLIVIREIMTDNKAQQDGEAASDDQSSHLAMAEDSRVSCVLVTRFKQQ